MTLKTTVSHSEIEQYLRCERQHFYAHGMRLRRKQKAVALNRGVLGHAALERFFNFIKDGGEFEAAKMDTIGWLMTQVSEATSFTTVQEVLSALTYFFDAGGLTKFEILAVEKEFTLEIEEGFSVRFIVDLIVRDDYGRIGVIDSKFVKNLYTERDTDLLPQLPKYTGMLRALGYDISWIAYNVLRWYLVKEPTQDTQYQFVKIDLTDERVRRTFQEHYIAGKRILARKQAVIDEPEGLSNWSNDALRVFNSNTCNMCSFRTLCLDELNDNNPQETLDALYTVGSGKRDDGHPATGRTIGADGGESLLDGF